MPSPSTTRGKYLGSSSVVNSSEYEGVGESESHTRIERRRVLVPTVLYRSQNRQSIVSRSVGGKVEEVGLTFGCGRREYAMRGKRLGERTKRRTDNAAILQTVSPRGWTRTRS